MKSHEPGDGSDVPATAVPADPDALESSSRERLVLDEEFSAFYRRSIRKLVGFLVNHGAPLPLATDIAQETMIKAYQRWPELREPQAWVHTVASRAYIRQAVEVREEPTDPLPEPTSRLLRPNAVAAFEARHDALLWVKRLPYRQRQVLAWTLSDYTPSEIAHMLGMTPEAVRASLKKARQAVAGYAKQGEEEQ